MHIAIVGTSHLTNNEGKNVRKICYNILKPLADIDEEIIVISGGAKGVDSIAVEVAKELGHIIIEILPSKKDWESYKERNMKIAQECDELYCITTQTKNEKCYHHKPKQDHQKTAGCYTSNQAKQLGKPCRLIITPRLHN